MSNQALTQAGIKPAEAEEVAALWSAYKQNSRNINARNKLVEHYLPLVRMYANQLCRNLPESIVVEDMITPGVFGLIQALKSYDPDRGIKFQSYCALRIRGAMLDEIRDLDWVPRLVRAQASKINHAAEAYRVLHGRPPSIDELAEHMELQVSELEFLILKSGTPERVDKVYESDNDRETHTIDRAENDRIPSPAASLQSREILRLSTKGLSKNERLILILYYYEGLKMKEIGHALCISESRVSQMHSQILQRLRTVLAGRESEFVIDVRD